MTARTGSGAPDRGSALMLMPAAVLIVLLLGAIAVDLGSVRLAQRRLAATADAAANDAATAALDRHTYFATGAYVLDPAAAETVLARSLAAHGLADASVEATITVGPTGDTVTVVLRGRAPYLFARSIPGAEDGAEITATATASARRR